MAYSDFSSGLIGILIFICCSLASGVPLHASAGSDFNGCGLKCPTSEGVVEFYRKCGNRTDPLLDLNCYDDGKIKNHFGPSLHLDTNSGCWTLNVRQEDCCVYEIEIYDPSYRKVFSQPFCVEDPVLSPNISNHGTWPALTTHSSEDWNLRTTESVDNQDYRSMNNSTVLERHGLDSWIVPTITILSVLAVAVVGLVALCVIFRKKIKDKLQGWGQRFLNPAVTPENESSNPLNVLTPEKPASPDGAAQNGHPNGHCVRYRDPLAEESVL